ncbi:MAG: hypothetical protein V3R96_00825, partial [Dehalococcoidales bacterium]
MYKKLGRWPGIISNKTKQLTKQLLEKDFRIVRNGLGEEETTDVVDHLNVPLDNSESVPAESLRLLIDRMITDVGQIAAGIKVKAEAEAQEEAVKIIDLAKQGAADIKKSVEVAAGQEAEEVLSALNGKIDITEEEGRKKARQYLLKVRQEIETEVREEYRRTHSRLLYSLLSTANDSTVSPFPTDVKEQEVVADRKDKKSAWVEEKAREEEKMARAARHLAEEEAKKAAKAEEKARDEEAKKAETARKQAENKLKEAARAEKKAMDEEAKKAEAARKQAENELKEAAKAEEKAKAEEAKKALKESKLAGKESRRIVVPEAEDTTASGGNMAQPEKPAVSETEPGAGKGSAEGTTEQKDTPDTEEPAPVQKREQVNEAVVEKPASEEREGQPADNEPITEKQASDQTTEDATPTEPDEPVLAQTVNEPIQPESVDLTLEQMVAQVARPEDDEKSTSSDGKAVSKQKRPSANEPAIGKTAVEPPPPLDPKAIFGGEVELAISVPVDPVAVSKLYNQLQSTPDMKILYTRGSWDRGTT